MSDFSLCIGCPFDDPDFGCLRLPGEACRLVDDETRDDERRPAFGANDVLHREVTS